MDDVEGFALLLALCCSHSLAGFEVDAKIAVSVPRKPYSFFKI